MNLRRGTSVGCYSTAVATGRIYGRTFYGRCSRAVMYLLAVLGTVFLLMSHWQSVPDDDDGFALIYFMTPPYYAGHSRWDQGDELSVPESLHKCTYSRCRITSNHALGDRANLIIFQGPFARRCCLKTGSGDVVCANGNGTSGYNFTLPRVSPTNAFVFYQRESPLRTVVNCLQPLDDHINYTWTYRLDSDLFDRYGSYSPIDSNNEMPESALTVVRRNFTKNVLWYVSNCGLTAESHLRLKYAQELQRHIDVDIFGQCANRSDGCQRSNKSCLLAVRSSYRFYLAFENSHCNDYVTEKLFDALRYGNVPIVRGLPREQYERLTPPDSFIHADDFDGPASLARHLLALAADEAAYARHHAWRANFRIENDDSVDMCELCRLATTRPTKTTRVSAWWNISSNCMVPLASNDTTTVHYDDPRSTSA